MKILGVAIAMIALLASCGDKETKPTNSSDSGLSVVFYVKDSVATHYTYFMESQEEIVEMEAAVGAKANELQQQYGQLANEYQSKMQRGLLSKNGESYYTKKLQDLQLEMTSLEQTEGAELNKKAEKFQEELLEKLDAYGKEFAEKNGYNLILAKEKMGGIMYADESMDVTMDLIEFMNEQDKK
ncbi:MAG: OmpH family outer membrane protein [Crocinitomicaceae bacterium]|nr:OmpH family outer membrane protein [Crocinitomicaceae bacterium]